MVEHLTFDSPSITVSITCCLSVTVVGTVENIIARQDKVLDSNK